MPRKLPSIDLPRLSEHVELEVSGFKVCKSELARCQIIQ